MHLLHIDNGLMRKDESAAVVERFRSWGVTENLHFVDASEQFLQALSGLADPEMKRIAIGNTFIEVCQAEIARLGLTDALLVQGTIYPDTIETGGTQRADVIKTHHNRVPIVEAMVRAGKVLEPIKDLYKVEVRELGRQLQIDRDFLDRHPFPGPGLGVRLLASAGAPDAAEAEELARINVEAARIAAHFELGAVALPIRSVGVKADLRSYEWPVMLFGPNARWDQILTAANRIYKEVAGVNRCVYDLTRCAWAPESPQRAPQLERREAYTTRARLDLLREADAAMMAGIARHGLMETIWQAPTAMLPISIDSVGEELVVLRPVLSERAMTARPTELPAEMVAQLRTEILALPGVSGLCLDVTTKPPGTIEWE